MPIAARRRHAGACAALCLMLLSGGCAQLPAPAETGAEETNYEGLVRVRNPRLDYAWVKPDIDLAAYRRIAFRTAEFEFRAVRPVAVGRLTADRDEFPVSERDRAELVRVVSEIFREELASSKYFTLVDDAQGADLLIVRIRLLDIISRVPPEPASRGEIYLDSVGEATLVVELIDSRSGEVLARAADRRAAEPPGSRAGGFGALRSSPVTAWQEVRRVARRWARLSRDRLDQLRDESVAQQALPKG